MRNRGRGVVAVALIVVMAVIMGGAAPASADNLDDEYVVVNQVNALRASYGLRPLALHPGLSGVSRWWSSVQAGRGRLGHNPDIQAQAPSNWVRLTENVGRGENVTQIGDAFVRSPSHFANLVDPDVDVIAVGVWYAQNGDVFVTQNFMTTAAPVIAAATPRLISRRSACTLRRARTGRCIRRTAVRR